MLSWAGQGRRGPLERMQGGQRVVHTNRSNKILFVQTPGVKVPGTSARGGMSQLEARHKQQTLRPGTLYVGRRALLAAWAASTVCRASLALLWVYQATQKKGPK